LVLPRAQRTVRLTTTLQHLGLALGGEAGARLSAKLQLSTSPDTLLRLVRQLPTRSLPTPTILGVDDWAIRRGHSYGTLLVDLERHRPIDLLPDRSAEALAAWLRTHPGVLVVSRDRSTEYGRGATRGAPDALQVLDRWHLVRNLREALERLLDRVHRRLAALPAANQLSSEPAASPYARSLRRSTTDQLARQERRSRRLARYEEVRALHKQGLSNRAIATRLHMSRTTVIRYLHVDGFPERAHSRRASILDPYVTYLQERWEVGCHNGAQLWREIQVLGFEGTRRMASNWVVLRRELLLGRPSQYGRRPALPKQPAADLLSLHTATSEPLPAPRQLVWVLLRAEQALSSAEQDRLQQLRRDKDLETAYTLAQRFCQMLRERMATALDGWLADCLASGIPELCNFARGLQREQEAVQAALDLPYSNGQVEGQVTKLKLLKRQGYGRAKLDLLRQRMLHAA
jgi:transposase